MSVNYVSSRQKHWIWSQKNLLHPPSWKEDTEVTKKKVQVIDGGFIISESYFFFFLTSETLILYRQSETNCSLETHQDNLNRLEHSRQKTFNTVSLVPSLLRLSSATTFFIKWLWFCFWHCIVSKVQSL